MASGTSATAARKRQRKKRQQGDLTEQNAVESSLLRLPAELRNAIWKPAYSDIWIEVSLRCFENIQRSKWRRKRRTSPSLYFDGPGPGLVCKQHWTEVVPIFLGICTFSFKDDRTFGEFLTNGSSIIAHVRRIAIQLDLIDISKSHHMEWSDAKGWADALKKVSHLSDRLESLEGVQISAKSWLPRHWNAVPFRVLGYSVWEKVRLSEIVRFFQQHRLKKELTSCEVTEFDDYYEGDMDRLRLTRRSVEIREHLLDYMG